MSIQGVLVPTLAVETPIETRSRPVRLDAERVERIVEDILFSEIMS